MAEKTFLPAFLLMRWGSGNLRFLVRSCLMYGRRRSSFFSISTTFRIWIQCEREVAVTGKKDNHTWTDLKRVR